MGGTTSLLDLAWGPSTGQGGDDSAAIMNALAWVNGAPNRALFIPPAPGATAYNYNQTANGPITFTQSLSGMFGAGRASQINFTGTTGDCVRCGGGSAVQYHSISDMTLTAYSATSGYTINWTSGGYGLLSRCLIINGSPNFGTPASSTGGNGVGLTYAAITGGYDFWNIVDTDIQINGNTSIGLDFQTSISSVHGTNFSVTGFLGTTSSFGIRFPNVANNQDTGYFSNFLVSAVAQGIVIAPTTNSDGDYYFSNGIIDATRSNAIVINGAGGAQRFTFSDIWFQAGLVVNPITALIGGAGYDLAFTDCRFAAGSVAGGIGAQIAAGSTLSPVQFTNCKFELCAGKGIDIQGDVVVQVVGGNARQCGIAINVAASPFTLPKSFSNFDVSDSTNTTKIATSSAINTYGGKLVIRNCAGINAALAQTSPGIPASTTALTNPFPYDMTVYITAGASTVAVAVGGTAVFTIPANGIASVRIPAGTSITLTYANAPSWIWIAD